MSTPDVIVIGAGISGLTLAWNAARAGRAVTLLERSQRVGGCIHSHRYDDGFWFELGAHTTYNSYGGFLDIAVGSGAVDELIERGPARATFGLLRDGETSWLTPAKVLLQLNWLEAALRFPRGLFRSKEGQTLASYYSGLIGPNNFARVLSPFLAAVPSQSADGFPASGPGSLFKKRPRRKEFPRSFGFRGGLGVLCDAAAASRGVQLETGVDVQAVAREGKGFAVTAADGRSWEAPTVAVAAPHGAASAMLSKNFGALAEAIGRVDSVELESVGLRLPRDKCWMRPCAFVVPVDDLFYSVVTRDPFPDDHWRAFAFHFRSGSSRDERVARICEVLRVAEEDLPELVEQRLTLPAPAATHAEIVAGIDRQLGEGRLALSGNYFDGLAIEDCVQRSLAEWERVR